MSVDTYASVSGYVQPSPPSIRFRSKYLLGAKSLDHKVLSYLSKDHPHPKAYFIWLGHNNLDWFADTNIIGQCPQEYLRKVPGIIAKQTISSLKRIVLNKKIPDTMTPMLVSGLVNFSDFLVLRNQVNLANQPKGVALSIEIFPSMEAHNQKMLLDFVKSINAELQKQIEEQKIYFMKNNFKLIYSNTFSEIPIKDLRILSESDLWHLSEYGRRHFASHIEDELRSLINRL